MLMATQWLILEQDFTGFPKPDPLLCQVMQLWGW